MLNVFGAQDVHALVPQILLNIVKYLHHACFFALQYLHEMAVLIEQHAGNSILLVARSALPEQFYETIFSHRHDCCTYVN